MNETHFKNLDLNLLRVFDALLEEESATRAGSKLGLTQSAISHALGRLRLSLRDELFVRSPSGLQATPRAVEMGGPVRAAAVLIITLFVTALMKMESALLISLLFICCLASLILSLIAFIMDIRLSLQALKLELGSEEPGAAS